MGQLQDPRVVGGAVGRVQLGREGHHPPCGSSEITSFTRIRHVLQIVMRGMGLLYCRHASLSAFTQQENIEKIEKIVIYMQDFVFFKKNIAHMNKLKKNHLYIYRNKLNNSQFNN